jgi:hypothetical protein
VLSTHVLIQRLRILGIDFRGLPKAIRIDVLLVVSGQWRTQEQARALEELLKATSSEALPCQQWLRLTELFCFRGRYPLAQICREHARQLAILPFMQPAARPPISWTNSIAAVLEGGECTDHHALDLILKKANIKGHEAAKWHLLLSVLNGEQVLESDLEVFDKTSYSEFVRNKNIVIVGPAPTEAQDAVEIDSSDVVIRLNHSLLGKGTDWIHKGLRTDVSCFNSEQTTALIDDRNGMLPSDIAWACFKDGKKSLDVHVKNADKQCRSFVRFDGMTFHGSYNMVPIIIMDLATLACRSVKIFHTDLMLSVSRYLGYNKYSFQDENKKKVMFLYASITHDPVLQYRTLKNVWKHNKIHGDLRFEQVMTVGLDDYLKELEQVYSKNTELTFDGQAHATSAD